MSAKIDAMTSARTALKGHLAQAAGGDPSLAEAHLGGDVGPFQAQLPRTRHLEVDQVVADAGIPRDLVQRGALLTLARVRRHGVAHDFGRPGARAVAHQQEAVGQQDGFVHVARDHEHRLVIGRGSAGERIEIPRVPACPGPAED